MQRKRLLQDLVDGLVAEGGIRKKDVEELVRHFFKVIEEGLLSDRQVKINGLGTFKLIEVEARNSVDVNTGEPYLIKEHLKLSFLPDAALKDLVNKPFAAFEPVEASTTATSRSSAPTPSIPNILKETHPDHEANQPDDGSAHDAPQDKPERPSANDQTPDVAEAIDPAPGEARQQTVQEMLAALKEEKAARARSESNGRRRSVSVVVWMIVGLLFLAGLVYWSVESNRKAQQERALKEQLMEQLVVEAAPLSGIGVGETPDSLSAPSAPTEATLAKPTEATPPTTTAATTKPTIVSTTTTKPTTTSVKPAATTKPATSTAHITRPSQVTVQSGDRLTLLAEKYYGHRVFWVYIYLENKAIIPNPNQVAAGTTLVLPKPHPTMMDPNNPEAIQKAEGIQQRILSQF